MADLNKENIKKGKVQGTKSNDNINLAGYAEKVTVYASNGSDIITSGSGKTTIYGQSGANTYNISPENTNTTIIPGVGKAYINLQYFDSSMLKKVKNDLKINIAENNIVTIKDYFKNRGEIYVNGSDLRQFVYNYDYSTSKKVNLTTGFTNDNIVTNSTTNYNDKIKSLDGNDTISTYGGNDTVYAGNGDDTIIGGAGNDKLYGGTGYNTYLVEGNDTIYIEKGSTSNILNYFPETSAAYKSKNNLVLKNAEGEKLTLANYFKYNQDVQINGGDIKAAINNLTINGKGKITDTHFNDSITGSKGADKIYSYGGSDSITAGKGNDKIYSPSSQSSLYFNQGDGKDTIEGHFSEISIKTNNDAYDISQLKLKLSGNDLIINYSNKDSITLKNYFLNTTNVNQIYLNGTPVINDLRSFVDSTYQNEYTLTTGNNKFYSMPNNNKIILPNDFDINKITKISKSGNNLVITGVYGSKDKLTVVDYYKNGYDIDLIKNGSSIGTLNQILLEEYRNNTENYGDLSGYEFALKVTGSIINDYLTMTTHNDIVKAGHGHDTIYGNEGKDTIYGGSGNDSLIGEDGNDKLYGDDGNDYIYGGYGNDTLKGGKGNDTLLCYEGLDKAYGEAGNDSIEIRNTNDARYYVDGGSGNDNINIYDTNYSTIYGGSGNDNINTDITYMSKIDAGSGNDHLYISNTKNSTIYGGSGNDYINISSDTNSSTIYAGSGNDIVFIDTSNNEIETSSGNDTITVTSGESNEIEAGSGNDFITVHSANNEIEGGSGNDKYEIYASNTIEDSSGNDYYNILFNNNDIKISIEDDKGKDTILLSDKIKDELDVSFAVRLNSKGKVIDKNDIDVVISNGSSNTITIDDYFGSGCIERIESSDGYYITKTQIQNVLQEVTAWLTTHDYISTEMAYQQNGNAMPSELTAIFNEINWQK